MPERRSENSPELQTILDALDDQDCRAIISALDSPMTADEVADAADVPLSTTYRKLDLLTEVSLPEEGIEIRADGRATRRWSASSTRCSGSSSGSGCSSRARSSRSASPLSSTRCTSSNPDGWCRATDTATLIYETVTQISTDLRPQLRTVRIAILLTLVVLTAPLAVDFVTQSQASSSGGSDSTDQQSDPEDASANDSGTTETTETRTASDTRPGSSDRPAGVVAYVVDAQGPGQLTVFNRTTEEVRFTTQRFGLYHDVDPSPEGEQTLTYVAHNVTGEAICPERLKPSAPCTENVIERINYSIGETERLYSSFVDYNGSSNWHDVDRVSGSQFLVGDIQFDRVFLVDAATGSIEWIWNVSAEYNRSTGGRPGDWTHLNDVEVLDENRYMVNLRNQDQVVFVHREKGLLDNRTLGTDDDHETLYEQHNPDYLPEERGGPAILVADSENNRVVEYQRQNGSWVQSWVWADARLRWPRDADRLPNDNTLVVDTHGTRLLEVSPSGEIVWQREVPRGVYEAELLSTGDESTGGRSMAAVRDASGDETGRTGTVNTTDARSFDGIDDTAQRAFLNAFPPIVLNGFLFVLPSWISPLSGALLLLTVVVGVLWSVGEGVRYAVNRFQGQGQS
jgi:hypothetical protein